MATNVISIVIPVYKNEDSIELLISTLSRLRTKVESQLEVVIVVDGSPDRSYELLSRLLPTAPFKSELLSLSRNFGAFSAIRAGMAAANGSIIAVIAADLQEPPELIVEFERCLLSNSCDIAFGQRIGRDDPFVAKIFSGLFWFTYRAWIDSSMPRGGIDVFACNRKVRDSVTRLEESNSSLIALLLWIGFRRSFVPYRRERRRLGRSAWTFRKKVLYVWDSLLNFSDLPLRIFLYAGLGLFGAASVISLLYCGAVFSGSLNSHLHTTVVLGFVALGGLNCLGIGVIGMYLSRTFENTKRRPNYIVQERVPFAGCV